MVGPGDFRDEVTPGSECDCAARFEINCSSRPVCVGPGNTLLTVIPNGPSSPASVFAQLATAPRTVLDTPSPAIGVLTDVEMMLMIRPYSRDFMPGTSA